MLRKAAPIRRVSARTPTKPDRAMSPDNVGRSAPRPLPCPQVGMQLRTADGTRRYLTAGERDAFLRQADLADRRVRTLCMTLAYAGCRLSESWYAHLKYCTHALA